MIQGIQRDSEIRIGKQDQNHTNNGGGEYQNQVDRCQKNCEIKHEIMAYYLPEQNNFPE